MAGGLGRRAVIRRTARAEKRRTEKWKKIERGLAREKRTGKVR